MSYTSYNFGVEIETIVEPWPRREDLRGKEAQVEWRRQLARRLQNRNLPAKADDFQRYDKHPAFYKTHWFITRDGSVRPTDIDHVPMEIVSPILNSANSVSRILSEFWEAMAVGFTVQRSTTCGGHVHVTPVNDAGCFSLAELQKCAFAVLATENFVQALLPTARKNNTYCKFNSVHQGSKWYADTAGRLDSSTLVGAQRSIIRTNSKAKLREYIQGGKYEDRYVLWNFKNTAPIGTSTDCIHTVEFRGGSQFIDKATSLKWVAFVVGFIHLALKEDQLHATQISVIRKDAPGFDTAMSQWWNKIRESARDLKMKRFLPEDWKQMRNQA